MLLKPHDSRTIRQSNAAPSPDRSVDQEHEPTASLVLSWRYAPTILSNPYSRFTKAVRVTAGTRPISVDVGACDLV